MVADEEALARPRRSSTRLEVRMKAVGLIERLKQSSGDDWASLSEAM